MSPYFQAVFDFYERMNPAILATPKNEWACDAYGWGELINMTPIEANFWEHLRNACGVMYPQYPIAGFFVDFANPVARVVVECDGKAYHLDKAKDAARDQKLNALGWDVYRLTGRQCNGDFDEATGDVGFTRKFIDALLRDYGIKRLTKTKLPRDYDDSFKPSAAQILMEAA